MNDYQITDGGQTLIVTLETLEGTLRTTMGRPADNPWTVADAERVVQILQDAPKIVPGEKRHTRKITIIPSWVLYVHVNVGPPTWLIPRARFTRSSAMVGWLRALVAISADRSRAEG